MPKSNRSQKLKGNNLKECNLNKVKNGNWTVAEIAIDYKPIYTNQPQITSIQDTHDLIRRLWDKEKLSLQEQFVALFFNTPLKMIGYRVISTGNMTGCLVDVKLLCSLALHSLCSFVVIAHNHPSGNINPSKYDIAITLKIKNALQLIDVELLDHFILVENGYISFADADLI